MSAREMLVEFERRIQLISPDLKMEDRISTDTSFSFLNAACKRFVITNYVQADSTLTGTRMLKKISDAIKGLVTSVNIDTTDQGAYISNAILPDNFLLYVRSTSNILSELATDSTLIKPIANVQIKEEEVNNILPSQFNESIIRNPFIVLNSNNDTLRILVIHDKYTMLDSIDLTYMREPKKFNVINVNDHTILNKCELPENVHIEIVELAVEMFITEAKYRLLRKEDNSK